MEGSASAQRIGFQLEKIVNELEQLQKQIAKRESGMQTIFSAMQDALLVVDSNRQVILTNQTFRKLFDAPEISVATPLLEIVRDATLDRLLTDAFRGVAVGVDQIAAGRDLPGINPEERKLAEVALRAVEAAGDIDGDGKADIVWQHKDSGMRSIWLMNGVSSGMKTWHSMPAFAAK